MKKIIISTLAISLIAFSQTAFSATFNVANTPEFREALKFAPTNGEDDTIILADGIYKTSDYEQGVSFIDNSSFTNFDINTTGSGILLSANNTLVTTKQISSGSQSWETYTHDYIISGKHYWEVTAKCGGDTLGASMSIVDENQVVVDSTSIITDGARDSGGNYYLEGFEQTKAEDVFMFALNMDDKTYFIGKNGTWFKTSNPSLKQSPIAKDLPDKVKFKVQIGSRECQPNILMANFGHTEFNYNPPISYFEGYCTDNNCEVSEGIDTDEDGIIDIFDKFPLIDISNFIDTDNDGAPDNCNEKCIAAGMASDDDDDGDGVLDERDEFSLISLGGLLDSDGDGVPNDCEQTCLSLGMVADDDNDGDGISDINDAYPNISLDLLDNLNLPLSKDIGFVHENLVWMRVDVAQDIISKFDAGRDETNEYAIAKSLFKDDVLKDWRHATYPELINLLESTIGNKINIDITQVGNGLLSSSILNKQEASALQQILGKTSTQYNEGAQGYQFRTTGHLETINGDEIWAEIVIYDYNDGSFVTIRDRQSQINPDDSIGAGAWLVIPTDKYDPKLRLKDSDGDGIPDKCGTSCQVLNLSSDTDDDNDGVLDTTDTYPLKSIGDLVDTDSDGAPNTCDSACVELGMTADDDDDNDGVIDIKDKFPLVSIEEFLDFDGDGAPFYCSEECQNLGMTQDIDDQPDSKNDAIELMPYKILPARIDGITDRDVYKISIRRKTYVIINLDCNGIKVDAEITYTTPEYSYGGLSGYCSQEETFLADPGAHFLDVYWNQYEEMGNYNISFKTGLISREFNLDNGTLWTQHFSCQGSCYVDLPLGASVMKFAIKPNPGFGLSEWRGACNGYSASCISSISDDFDLSAVIEPQKQDITPDHYKIDTNGMCVLSDSGLACYGSAQSDVTAIPVLTNTKTFVSNGEQTCAVDDYGLKCWGGNTSNLTKPPFTNIKRPLSIAASSWNICAISEGEVLCWPSNNGNVSPHPVPTLNNPTKLFAGQHHFCAVDNNGFQCWGESVTNIPSVINFPEAYTSGLNHACVMEDGRVICWGDNSYGQLNIPDLDNVSAITAGWNHTCAISQNKIICWGNNSEGQLNVPLNYSKAYLIDAHLNGTCAITQEGNFCWGANYSIYKNKFPRGINFKELNFNYLVPEYTFYDSFPVFEKLIPTAKIIVTSSEGENFVDIARYVDEVSVVGQTLLVSGSGNVDGFMVMPGVKYDLTNLKGGKDTIYFSGTFAEYAESILLDSGTGVMQLSRLTDIGEEIVQFIATASAADVLVFTDGAISTSAIKDAVINETPMDDLVLDSSVNALDTKPTTGGTVKHIVLDNNGAGVMALGPNISTLISGSSGIDQIYVPAGSVVDASNLKSGQDEIYLEGALADYSLTLDNSGNITLTRDVSVNDENVTEQVTVASGGNVATNDLVIFADQQLQTQVLKEQYLN